MGLPDVTSAMSTRSALPILDALPQLLWEMTHAGTLLHANKACREFTGLSAEDLSQRRFADLVHPHDYSGARDHWHTSTTNRQPLTLELRLHHHSGAYRWVRVHLHPLTDEHGPRYLGSATDVEGEHRAVLLQRVTAALSGALTLAQVTDVILTQALTATGAYAGHVTLLCEQELHMIGSAGYPPEHLQNWQVIPLSASLPITDVVRSRQPRYLNLAELAAQYPHTTRNVQASTACLAAVPLITPGGALGVLALSFRETRTFDAEERAFIETLGELCAQAMERARLHQETREREARYRSLVEATSQIQLVWSTPTSGVFEDEQNAWSDFTGQSVGGLLGWGWLDAVHPDDRASTAAAWTHAINTRSTYRAEHRLIRRDGVYRHMLVRAVPILDDHGNIQERVGVHTDVTDLKQAEAEVRELNATLEARVRQRTLELEQVNDELRTFTYSVSHDLQAPVRHILGFTGLLARSTSGNLNDKSARYLDAINEAAQRMGQLIDDLLQLSRLGRQGMHWQPVNLTDVVNAVRAQLAPDSEQRHVEWRIGHLPTVTADQALLRVAMTNLLSNALKYTRPRDVAVIEVWAEQGEHDTTVHVRDNGVGFDPKWQARLYSAFQRLHSPQDFEGNGVGLANVRRAIHRHGGRTWAQGEPERGATFSFTLPRQHPDA